MHEVAGGIDQPGNLLLTEDGWQRALAIGERNMVRQIRPSQCLNGGFRLTNGLLGIWPMGTFGSRKGHIPRSVGASGGRAEGCVGEVEADDESDAHVEVEKLSVAESFEIDDRSCGRQKHEDQTFD